MPPVTHSFYTFIWLSVLSFIEMVFHLEWDRPDQQEIKKNKIKIKNNNGGSASMFSLLHYSSCSPTQIWSLQHPGFSFHLFQSKWQSSLYNVVHIFTHTYTHKHTHIIRPGNAGARADLGTVAYPCCHDGPASEFSAE